MHGKGGCKTLENQKLINYGNYIYVHYQYYLFNVDSFFVVLYIAVCLVVHLFGNISSCGPGTVSACLCKSAEKENEKIMESTLATDLCGINESLVSENVG